MIFIAFIAGLISGYCIGRAVSMMSPSRKPDQKPSPWDDSYFNSYVRSMNLDYSATGPIFLQPERTEPPVVSFKDLDFKDAAKK